MINKIKQYISDMGIEQSLCEQVLPLFRLKEVQPGDIILDIGENTKVICLILQGLVRGYYLDEDGNDITKCFSREKEWCCFYNYLDEGPSLFCVEALEPCILAEIDVRDIRELLIKQSSIAMLFQRLFKEAFLKTEEKSAAFQKLDAKERYLQFREQNPDICNRVKQEHIASYLGITPSSLSRIKRDL